MEMSRHIVIDLPLLPAPWPMNDLLQSKNVYVRTCNSSLYSTLNQQSFIQKGVGGDIPKAEVPGSFSFQLHHSITVKCCMDSDGL